MKYMLKSKRINNSQLPVDDFFFHSKSVVFIHTTDNLKYRRQREKILPYAIFTIFRFQFLKIHNKKNDLNTMISRLCL